MKETAKWNVTYGEKNENIPNARSVTESYQIDEEQDFTRDNDKKYPIRKR